MTHIIVVKPGKLKASDRKVLTDAGVIALELDDPSDLRLVTLETAELDANELAWAAVDAIDQHGISDTAKKFVQNIRLIMTKRLNERKARP